MARGKQLNNQTIYNVMASYAVTNNYHETARLLKIPVKTVETTVKKHYNDEEFAQLRTEKRKEFSDRCSDIIDKLLITLDRKLDILLTDDNLLAKTKLTEITTAIGTLYDKMVLAQNKSTANVSFILPEEVMKYAG